MNPLSRTPSIFKPRLSGIPHYLESPTISNPDYLDPWLSQISCSLKPRLSRLPRYLEPGYLEPWSSRTPAISSPGYLESLVILNPDYLESPAISSPDCLEPLLSRTLTGYLETRLSRTPRYLEPQLSRIPSYLKPRLSRIPCYLDPLLSWTLAISNPSYFAESPALSNGNPFPLVVVAYVFTFGCLERPLS